MTSAEFLCDVVYGRHCLNTGNIMCTVMLPVSQFHSASHRCSFVCVFFRQLLYELEFDWTYMIRGLTIDKIRGNILKIDRHKYVKVAYHGFQQLSREERLDTYTRSESMRAHFHESHLRTILQSD